MTWPLVLLLGIYIGGGIPALVIDMWDEATGMPAPLSHRLAMAAAWPLIVFGGNDD